MIFMSCESKVWHGAKRRLRTQSTTLVRRRIKSCWSYCPPRRLQKSASRHDDRLPSAQSIPGRRADRAVDRRRGVGGRVTAGARKLVPCGSELIGGERQCGVAALGDRLRERLGLRQQRFRVETCGRDLGAQE